MECNRDEAVRAREIANMKLSMEDFYAAKRFVLKARKLFPTLEGLSHMLHILEVHIVAQTKVGGTEMDWYGILQVDPGADKVAIQKQYRKLALFLHPDKNKVVGAEEAFKLVQNAWDTLSDDEKRAKHDKARIRFWTACPNCKKKLSYRRVYENQKIECCECKHHYVMRDIYSTASGHESSGDDESIGKKETPSNEEKQANRDTEGDTFISACPNCAKQYRYLRKNENATTRCPGCEHNFVIRDIYSTPSGHESSADDESVGKEETPSNDETQANRDTEGGTFIFACPNCAKQYRYLTKNENATTRCPGCEHSFVIRDVSTASGDENLGNEKGVEKRETPCDKEKRARNDTERDIFSSACPNCAKEYWYLRKYENAPTHCIVCKQSFFILDVSTASGDENLGNKERADHYTERDTFSSACLYCGKQYRYLRKYENATTHCSGCKHSFVILDVSTASGDENLGNKEGVGKNETPSDKEKRAHNDRERDIFSSACPNCAKQYRYLRKYENSKTHCSGCKHSFVIRDIHSTASRDESRGNEQTVEEEDEFRRPDPRQPYCYPVYGDPTNFWAGCPNCKQYEQYEPKCRYNELHCPICKHIFKASYEDLRTTGYNGRREFTGWFQMTRKKRGERNVREKRQKRAHHDLEKGCPN